jgi:hypothetical protein
MLCAAAANIDLSPVSVPHLPVWFTMSAFANQQFKNPDGDMSKYELNVNGQACTIGVCGTGTVQADGS